MIEYNYENYGAEITLEKLFLDFVNEPLKAVQSFFEPADKTPNILDMGSSKVVAAFMADKLTDIAKNVTASKDGLEFDIPDHLLFDRGTSKPQAEFINIMEKLTAVTSGLKESEVNIVSALFSQAVVGQSIALADKVAQTRLELVKNKIAATFEHSSNKIMGAVNVKDKKGEFNVDKLVGFIHISIKPKLSPVENKKESIKENANLKKESTVRPQFDQFVNETIKDVDQVKKTRTADGIDPNLYNPVEMEINKINQDSEPISK